MFSYLKSNEICVSQELSKNIEIFQNKSRNSHSMELLKKSSAFRHSQSCLHMNSNNLIEVFLCQTLNEYTFHVCTACVFM